MYAPNAETQYQPFLVEVDVGLQKITSAESIVLLGDLIAHVGTDNKTWKGIIERQGVSDMNKNGRCSLQFCITNGVCIMNIFFWHNRIHKYTWYIGLVLQYFIIDFYIVSVDFSSVVDVELKEELNCLLTITYSFAF